MPDLATADPAILQQILELLQPAVSVPTETETEVAVELPAEMLEDIKALKTLRRDLTAAERAKKALTEKIYAALGTAEVGTIAGKPVVIVNTVNRTDLDRDLLKRAFPEAATACEKPGSYTTLSLKP